MNVIDLPFWEPRKVPITAMVNIVGARGSGKTTLTKRYLFERRHDYDGSIVMCGSSDGKKAYSHCMPPASIMKATKKNLKEKLGAIQKVLDRQNEIAEMYPDGKDDPRVRSVLMLWDDVMFLSDSLMRHGTTLEFYSNGRHAKTGSINAVQYVNQLPPFARDQSEVLVIMGKDIAPEMIEKLHKYWFRKYFTLEELTETLDMLTKMHMALVWDKTQHGIFVFDADPEGKQPGNAPVPRQFTFGSKEHHYAAWRYAKRPPRPSEIRARIVAKNAMEFKPKRAGAGVDASGPAAAHPDAAGTGSRAGSKVGRPPPRIRIQGRDGRTVAATSGSDSSSSRGGGGCDGRMAPPLASRGGSQHRMPPISEVAPALYGAPHVSAPRAAAAAASLARGATGSISGGLHGSMSHRRAQHAPAQSKVAALAAYLDAGTTAIGTHSLASRLA